MSESNQRISNVRFSGQLEGAAAVANLSWSAAADLDLAAVCTGGGVRRGRSGVLRNERNALRRTLRPSCR